MEIITFVLVAAVVGLVAAALGGIFAIYSSRQE